AAAAWVFVNLTGDENGGRGSANGGDDGVPTLSASEMLLVTMDDAGKRLVALDVDSGESRTILDRASGPTITHDRKWMVYLFGDPKVGLVPHLAQVDGSRDAPLLRSEARAQCPFSGRPP